MVVSFFAVTAALCAVGWEHPAGLVTSETLSEIRSKLDGQAWARDVYEREKRDVEPWLTIPIEDLRRVFPTTMGNVYHNFSCPADRSRLTFDPFKDDNYVCPVCGAVYPRDTDPGVYGPGDRYHGTMYDGWKCMFYQKACTVAASMGVIGVIDGSTPHIERGIDILVLYADTIAGIETRSDPEPSKFRILTYHREGDNKVLNDVACAYELLRDRMTDAQRARFEKDVLLRMLNDTVLEPVYTTDWNNVYQWHRTIIQTGLALERDDLIDWSFGYGPLDPEHQPEHRSIRRLAAAHFKPDGAYWEMCSGYHLYPLFFFCELAVLSRNISAMDPQRFPPEKYDLTDPRNPEGAAIKRALEWFMSMSMPDRTMPTIGDSMAPRGAMTDYYAAGEVGYRFYDVRSVGDYAALRGNERTWAGLLYGAPEIVQQPTPFTSSFLSSGWVSLRNESRGDRMWAGLNALIPGGGHQHADRLGLVTYAHGQLLALEKATPYNEATTRELGTFSQSHTTVTVDMQSQPQGESLAGEQIPTVALFFAPALAQFAELHGDHLYAQTSLYRRSVALVDGVILDCFRVEGGSTHDWMVHHAGEAPRLSVAVEPGAFEPAAWLYNGADRVLHASVDGAWDAQWNVNGVTSRLTMLPATGTHVYVLETYPVDNAVITPRNPACQTLCVRRTDNAPFVAVWDTWTDSAALQSVSPGEGAVSLCFVVAGNTYYALFGPGEAVFDDGASLRSDAAFTLVRNRDAFVAAAGTAVTFTVPEGALRATWGERASVAALYANRAASFEVSGDIHYDTYGGEDHLRPVPGVHVSVEGGLWQLPE